MERKVSGLGTSVSVLCCVQMGFCWFLLANSFSVHWAVVQPLQISGHSSQTDKDEILFRGLRSLFQDGLSMHLRLSFIRDSKNEQQTMWRFHCNMRVSVVKTGLNQRAGS